MNTLDSGHGRLMATIAKATLRDMDPQIRAWLLKLASIPGDWPQELAVYVAKGHDIDAEVALVDAAALVRELAEQRWETDRWLREELDREVGGLPTDPTVLEWYMCGAQRADALVTGPRLRCFEPLPEPGRDDLPRFADWGDALDWLHAETQPLTGLFRRAVSAGDDEMVCRLYDLLVGRLGPGGPHSTDGTIHAAARSAARNLESARAIAAVSVAEAEIYLAAGDPDTALTRLEAAGDAERARAEVQRVRGMAYASLAKAANSGQEARYQGMAVEHLQEAISLGDAGTAARARLALADQDRADPADSRALLTATVAALDGSTDRQGYHLAGEAKVSIAILLARDNDEGTIAAINTAGAHLGAEIGGRARVPLTTAHRLYVTCGKELAANGQVVAAKQCFTVLREVYANLGLTGLPGARDVSKLLEGLDA